MLFFLFYTKNHAKSYSFFFVCCLCFCTQPQKKAFVGDQYGIFSKPEPMSALIVPLDMVSISLGKGTPSSVLAGLNDTFFIEAVNALAQYEASTAFSLSCFPGNEDNSQASDSMLLYDLQALRAAFTDNVPVKLDSLVKRLCARCTVDLVIMPYKCALKETLEQPAGWRSDKYGQSYERPSTSTAEAGVCLRIWDREGRVMFEKTGTGACRQPVLYSVFKQEKKSGDDMVSFSKKYFAPPLVRALSEAVKSAFSPRP
jgi:hypothetical protein